MFRGGGRAPAKETGPEIEPWRSCAISRVDVKNACHASAVVACLHVALARPGLYVLPRPASLHEFQIRDHREVIGGKFGVWKRHLRGDGFDGRHRH